jgi:arginine decarboxylase
MQHEPELMFETLKHRAEECGEIDEDGMANSTLANSLARSFHNMPYLAAASSCCLTAMNNHGLYYCSEDDYDIVAHSGAGAGAGDDEQWSYCCA